MKEILPGIFEVQLESTSPDTSVINIYLIPGGKNDRVLMIDAGYRSRKNKEVMTRELADAGIPFDKLDVFLTHKHHDHTGLANFYADRNAVIYMNPKENIHPYDCLYFNNTPEAMQEQVEVLKTVGVTKERTPVLWERYMEMNREIQKETLDNMFNELTAYPYQPLEPGQVFPYGEYTFKTVLLKGHTYGQMGLYDEEHKIIFSADQMINGIVPIVGTSYLNDGLLEAYLKSVEEFPRRFQGYTVYPSHMEPFSNLEEISARILRSYQKKIAKAYDFIKEHPHKTDLIGMTVQEIAFLSYGLEGDYGWDSMYQTKMIITKTFSTLEYLRTQGKVRIVDAVLPKDEGIIFWRLTE